MSKITNDGLTLSGLAQDSCTHMATVGVKGLTQAQLNSWSPLLDRCHCSVCELYTCYRSSH